MLLCMMQACTTVAPWTIREREVMLDTQGNQTAGVLALDDDGAAILDVSAVKRYQWLAAQYGDKLSPPMGRDLGLEPVTRDGQEVWRLRPDRLVDWMTMTRWHRDGHQ